ncbi:hypothetical protein JCM10212_005181 [Sporobolomyces blumeae]
MPPAHRSPTKEPSPSTRLVRELYSFGLEEPVPCLPSTVSTRLGGHSPPSTSSDPAQPEASTSKLPDVSTLTLGKPLEPSPSTGSSPTTKAEKLPPASTLRKLLRSTEHTVRVPRTRNEAGAEGDTEERVLTSWKMADYAYKREPCPFPTRARGLFTEKVGDEEYRIVARGYDKFFNVNEVSWTQWDKISEHSTGPYELTTKSNGCIILIAALTPTSLVVTSKHSIGRNAAAQTEQGVSHSERGEYWLERHLDKAGRSKEELAKELYDRNLTAVAELCDDSFEEHVLPYPDEATGLHLHGLNHNTPILDTLPSSEVAAFARSWGMIPTAYFTFPSVVAVKTYCETVEQAGGVEFTPGGGGGPVTPVEGFVVRGKKRGGAPGEAFFWKVKYDEPYLMYREWRELTRKCLAAWPDLDAVDPKKVKNPDSRLYLWWVKREIERDPAKFESWKVGKGMIRTREEFQQWDKSSEGKQARRDLGQVVELDEEERKHVQFDKTLIVPIAIQGCGKTALGLELSHLFGWGHVQSDDFLVKKPAPHFLRKIKELLNSHDVVYADKNNHQGKHRSDLVDLVNSLPAHRVRLVALVYPVDSPTLPRDKFHALMSSRIVERGANHQSLRAGESHESIVWQFLGQHEAFDPVSRKGDGRFDHVIEMRPEWNQAEALERVVEELSKIEGMGVSDPGEEKRREAIEYARAYKVQHKKESNADGTSAIKTRTKAASSAGPRYYGLSVPLDVEALVEPYLPRDVKDDRESLWNVLLRSSRVERNPHVTLVHQVELQSKDDEFRARKQALWDKYEKMVADGTSDGATNVERTRLEVDVVVGPRVVWDSRTMSIEVSSILVPPSPQEQLEQEQGGGATGDKIEMVPDRGAHITVGTRSSDIRPIEGKFIMEAVLRGETETKEGGSVREVRIEEKKVRARLAGLS